MNPFGAVFQGKLALFTINFTTKCFPFCMKSRKRGLVTQDNGSTTSRAISVRRDVFQSPYEQVVRLMERMLRLPSIATYLYPILISEHAEPTESWKDPRRPLKTFVAHGYTLNILLNELESPFVATINLFERADESDYEAYQTQLFWKGCIAAGFAPAGIVGRQLWFSSGGIVADERADGEYLDLAMTTVAAILDVLEEKGRMGTLDPRYTRPSVVYPSIQNACEGAPRHAVLAAELSRTEVAYMQDLERLMTYASSVRAHVACDGFKIDTATIFGHIDELHALHREFSMRIQYMAAMPADAQFLEGVYAGLTDRFSVYSRFCAGREQAQQTYRKALPALKAMAENGGGRTDAMLDPVFEVPALFMRPVQRLAQYPILFQSMVDALCESCTQLTRTEQTQRVRVVKSAHAAMRQSKRILRRANEATREAMNQAHSADFFERLDIPLSSQASDVGRLLTATSRVSTTVGGGSSFDAREAFLFERSLIVCKTVPPARHTDASRSSRIKRTLSSLQLTMRSPSLRFKAAADISSSKRQSASSASSLTLGSSASPDSIGAAADAALHLLPAIDMGHSPALISPSPSPSPILLGSHASLLSLREDTIPTIRFAPSIDSPAPTPAPSLDTSASAPTPLPPRLSVCEQIPVRAISVVSLVSEPHGFMRLGIQTADSSAMVVFRQLSSETAALWVRMLKQAVRLVPVDDANVCATPGAVSSSAAAGCLLINPDLAPGGKIAIHGYV
ncbi:Guanine nucleotide exchange factor for Cdc42p [Coemansia sp. Benny D160-2]|nr:Guanine nucleotide exchange factor for Cdc42p [Coemansia sp. Benny D160-2]